MENQILSLKGQYYEYDYGHSYVQGTYYNQVKWYDACDHRNCIYLKTLLTKEEIDNNLLEINILRYWSKSAKKEMVIPIVSLAKASTNPLLLCPL